MKTRIQMTKPEFIVKEEDGIVVCKISARANFADIMPTLSVYSNLFRQFGMVFIDDERSFTSIAKLHKSDKWNEVQGKRIAESKCKRKIFDFYSRVYKHFISLCNKDLDAFKKIMYNTTNAMHIEDNHLKELMQ